ncbi:MAG: C4-dicarboxylate ABC transporter permease [Melioribacteraceae bacterium]|nr:MAG: C4-dicarboxylate ABC transporter permease [Melioribacteraceae bacterium]
MNLNDIKVKVDNVIKWCLIVIMAAMTINVLWQVFTRFILQNPSSYTEELARYMLIWLGILGASYVAGQKMHLAIDLLSLKLKGKSKSYLEIFIQSLIFFFSLFVMVIGGFNLVQITLSLNQISAALQVPLGYVYAIVPVSGLIMMFYSSIFIIDEMKKLKSI